MLRLSTLRARVIGDICGVFEAVLDDGPEASCGSKDGEHKKNVEEGEEKVFRYDGKLDVALAEHALIVGEEVVQVRHGNVEE